MKIGKKIGISVVLLCILILAGSASAAVDFPAGEAGISAYVKAKSSINLNDAKSAFATIERESSTYIIGTVALSLHAEEEYPHIYVSTDGWIVAYYPNGRPSSWILPWADYNGGPISSTTLSKAAGIVATAVGGTTTGLKYYDFRFADASKMILIIESVANGENFFKVTIPTSFMTYAVDWSHYKYTGSTYTQSNAYLDDALFSNFGGGAPQLTHGSFLGQFGNGIEHTIKLSAYKASSRIGLVLEYAE
jgi:hypothetical protein